ncbi:secretion protein EccK [Mycolicibacterium sp. 120266]|uniref:secretion protein EccK n=1 Tax=Mycolicibacterium sp. 120266 TaxID=3090601 RepID=UPI00299DFB32|nr:secretion protein EccK [Mycolicibacterium sp. 120266]MDX1875390.1 secretion protein EccK [Mycolicibacterium sp. 120266]
MQAPVQPPPTPLSSATPATPLSAPAAPIEQAATSSPTTPAAAHPAVPTGGGGPAAAPAAPPSAPAAPTPPMPLGPPSTPPPAAPVPPSPGALGPGVAPAATTGAQSGGAAAAPIPVSAARAERDLMATSAAAGALKRQMGGNDPLSVARRIAAALNAPDMARPNDIGFFWLVALTAADTIVVANSYGIAYLPEGVSLPEQVKLASADSSIPAAERARWATYPVAALTGWAQAHDTTLRAVIGAKAHLEGIDPGAHKVLLEDDDIPATGKMTGRSRLEISFPDAAAKLAAVKDPELVAQLPPAGADNTPPANESFTLWFDVMQPLMSAASGREVAHLAAFVRYAAHAADLALYRAHTALEIADQRAAVADWLYWLHQYDLLTEAQATVTATT